MPVTDWLIGKQGLQDQRDEAIDFAEERYDPSQYNPLVNQAREQATEGISQGQEAQARQRTVESLFRPTDTSIYGGSQSRAIAGQQQQNRQAQAGMAQFESQLTQQDIQSKQQGQQQFAQARTQQNQLSAQRDAAIEEAEMQYESEVQKRRQQLGSTVGNLAGTAAAFIPGVGPLAAGAIGAGGGALLGGSSGAITGAGAGLSTAFQKQQNEDLIGQLTGGGEQQQTPQQPTQSTPAQQPQDQMIQPDMSGIAETMDLGQQMQVPQGQQQATSQQQPQTQPMSQTSEDNQFNMIEYARSKNFIDELMNFEGEMPEQQTQQQTPLGNRLYDRPQQAVETLFGRGFGLPMDISRGVLNTVDMFGDEYSRAQQEFQQEQGVSY